MAVLTEVESEEYITYLTGLTKSADSSIAEQARATLAKYGFNPAEPRAAGRWTAGGTTVTTTETPQRRQRERGAADAHDRAEADQQRAEASDRIVEGDAKMGTHHRRRATAAEIRHQHGIPTGRAFTALSREKQAAAHALITMTNAVARLQERRAALQERLARVQAEMDKPNVTNATLAMLSSRRSNIQRSLTGVDAQARAARKGLSRATAVWGGKSRKSATADLVKAGAKPGQRYRHGWIPITPGMEDLGIHTDRPHHEKEHVIAAHRVTAHHGHPVDIKISKWEDSPAEEEPAVSIDTHPPMVTHHYASLEDAPWIGEDAGKPFELGYSGAMVDHKGAQRAADHLHDLIAIGRSGYKAAPVTGKKKTKHQRAAEKLELLIEQDNLDLGDKVNLGDSELPITVKDLRELLAPHLPADLDAKRLTRRVNHPRDESYMDSGDLHMRLDTSGDQPLIQIAGRERESTPWDPNGEDAWQTSHLTMDQAEELANRLDQYADALPKE